jgi:hypothetical protein
LTAAPSVTDDATAVESSAAAATESIERPDPAEWADIIEALRRDAQPVAWMQHTAAQSESVDTETVNPPAEEIAASEVVDAAVVDDAVVDAAAVETAEAITPQDPPAEENQPRRKTRRKSSVEDEWGFFDPDRAGFAALLAKLEEITEDDSRKSRRT